MDYDFCTDKTLYWYNKAKRNFVEELFGEDETLLKVPENQNESVEPNPDYGLMQAAEGKPEFKEKKD